jgi:T-complex protein 1 subunit zeta
MEIAKIECLKFLEEFKKDIEITRELLVNVAKTSLNTKIHSDLANPLSEILVDAIYTISAKKPDDDGREKPIDLHMIEIMHM